MFQDDIREEVEVARALGGVSASPSELKRYEEEAVDALRQHAISEGLATVGPCNVRLADGSVVGCLEACLHDGAIVVMTDETRPMRFERGEWSDVLQ